MKFKPEDNWFKKYNFSLLVGKTSPTTWKACQEPVSSTCMIMVAHLVSTALPWTLKISSDSHFPQFLASRLMNFAECLVSQCRCVSFKPPALKSKPASSVPELRRWGTRLEHILQHITGNAIRHVSLMLRDNRSDTQGCWKWRLGALENFVGIFTEYIIDF